MVEPFLSLPFDRRSDVIILAASCLGRTPHLIAKDVWAVWTLKTLFESGFGEHLVFKGGTSLSKAYGDIQRFSENVDIMGDNEEALPVTHSQEIRWTKAMRPVRKRGHIVFFCAIAIVVMTGFCGF